jgi:hypothetical protein
MSKGTKRGRTKRNEGDLWEHYVEVNEQINKCIQDNRRIGVDEPASKMCHGKKPYQNDLRPNPNYFILMKSGNV